MSDDSADIHQNDINLCAQCFKQAAFLAPMYVDNQIRVACHVINNDTYSTAFCDYLDPHCHCMASVPQERVRPVK